MFGMMPAAPGSAWAGGVRFRFIEAARILHREGFTVVEALVHPWWAVLLFDGMPPAICPTMPEGAACSIEGVRLFGIRLRYGSRPGIVLRGVR